MVTVYTNVETMLPVKLATSMKKIAAQRKPAYYQYN